MSGRAMPRLPANRGRDATERVEEARTVGWTGRDHFRYKGIQTPMQQRSIKERHIIFVDELHRHSDREVCLGAAEYAAERPAWIFDLWPVTFVPPSQPTASDMRLVSGVLTTERGSCNCLDSIAGSKCP